MKKKDIYFSLGIILFFAPFVIYEPLMDGYKAFNEKHGMIMSFVKFAILATTGEVIGLRIRSGSYTQPGFGLVPRAIVWGLLGLTIQMAFVIFANGAPAFLQYLGMQDAAHTMADSSITFHKIVVAFAISTSMNLIYAPVMMTLHKITDAHIEQNGGKLNALIQPIPFGRILSEINWDVQWNFVFKKTIPFFWIPAHTITFLLPTEYRVLFAAFLGIVLGILLAVAAGKGKESRKNI